MRRSFAAAMAAVLFTYLASEPAALASSNVADVDAAARAAGNRPKIARTIGDALFATNWPVQVTKVRVDAFRAHAVAGLVLSGVKFHGSLDRAAFEAEISQLVALAFAHSDIEEVDVWATVPLKPVAHEVVSGDKAMPTSRVVFAVTVRRAHANDLMARLRSGRDVFYDADWLAKI